MDFERLNSFFPELIGSLGLGLCKRGNGAGSRKGAHESTAITKREASTIKPPNSDYRYFAQLRRYDSSMAKLTTAQSLTFLSAGCLWTECR